MPMSDDRRVTAASPRLGRRPGLTLALVALPFALAACSSGSSSAGTATSTVPSDTTSASASSTPSSTGSASPSSAAPTSTSATPTAPPSATTSATPTATSSATGSASPSATASATGTPSTSPTPSATPSGTPSTVSPSPSGSVAGITVAYSPVIAAASQQVTVTAGTSRALAGSTAYIVKWNDGAPRVLGTGTVIGSGGVARTYVQLLRTGVLQVVVPQSPLVAGPFDPTTPLRAQSARFTVTIR